MENLCEELGLPLSVFSDNRRGFIRYWKLTFETLGFLRRVRPRVVLVQNPSLVLTLLTYLLRPFLGRFRLIVDAHNEAVDPYVHSRWGLPWVARQMLRRSDLTIVSNVQLKRRVAEAGGNALVLPDRLPVPPISCSLPPTKEGTLRVMVVASYAPDEPIAEILQAASDLGGAFSFSVTGNDRKLDGPLRSRLPSNVRLTGFLEEGDYWELMGNSHVVLDLTSMPDCLVCGAYEALAMGRPMILSENAPTKALFGEIAITTSTRAGAIAKALQEMDSNYDELVARLDVAREEYSRNWLIQAATLSDYIREI
jgi:glycosyltransferase involved in cell wall biosynthesis